MPKLANPPNLGSQVRIITDTDSSNIELEPGWFGLVRQSYSETPQSNQWTVLKWENCRDRFQKQSTNIKRFLFVQGPNIGFNVIAFIYKLEEHLNIHQKSIMGLTQRKSVIWIEPSSWWLQSAMRRSVFTIFLRCGRTYKRSKDNFKKACLGIEFARDTDYAIERFLSGNTRYTGRASGWVNQFCWCEPSKKETDKLLIKP